LSAVNLRKVLDDPLSIGLTETSCRFAAEGVADGGAFAVVFDGGYTSGLEEAVTVTVTLSPAEKLMPVKS
jgi:hypothetical protein